jgi:hypothetical protein
MKQEKVYKNVKNGSLIKVKDSFGVVISSEFNLRDTNYSTNDPYLYKADVGGVEMLLLREAFDIVQEP